MEIAAFIAAPPERVWAVAQDPSRRVEWDQRVAVYEWLGPVGAGSEIRLVLRMGLIRPEARGVMRRFVPPRQSAVQILEASHLLVPVGAGSWTFEPVDGGTRFTTRFTLKTEALPWWVWRGGFRLAVWWDTWRSVRRLKRMVEGEARGAGLVG